MTSNVQRTIASADSSATTRYASSRRGWKVAASVIAAAAALGATGSALAAKEDADMILHNGRIVTVDGEFSIAQAVAIRDGRFIAVGKNNRVLRHEARETKVIDLQGKMVLPGLIDGHAHMDREGLRYQYPSLAGARTKEQILAIIAREVSNAQPGEWVITMPLGDPPHHFEARQILADTGLNRYDLDTVSPDNPVYIRSIWGFWDTTPLVAIANSEALRIANVTRDSQPPYPGVTIDRDANGEPTGVFREGNSIPAVEHSLMKVLPRFTHERRVRGIRKAMQVYNSFGTTSTYEGHGVASEVVRAYKEVWTDGDMTVRSALVISPTPGWYNKTSRPELEEMMRDWATSAGGEGFGDPYLRMSGVFISASGDNGLAATLASQVPYTAWASYFYDDADAAEFRQSALWAGKHDLRGHVIGGGDTTLNVYEEVDQAYGIVGKRWVIEHVGTVTDTQIARMKALGIVPTAIPPTTVWKAMPPATVAPNFAAWKSIMDAGLPLVLCTDNVPANPFFTLWTVVTRTNRFTGMPLNPSQALSREQALRAMTINGAYLSFEENVKGSIEVGKYADLIVIDRDYLRVPAMEIKDIKVLTTIVGGKVVYDAL